jgi:hypothetical protein
MVGVENNGNSVNRRNGADVMCGSNSSGNGGLLVLVCWDVNAYLDGFQVRAHTVYALSSEVGSLSEPPVPERSGECCTVISICRETLLFEETHIGEFASRAASRARLGQIGSMFDRTLVVLLATTVEEEVTLYCQCQTSMDVSDAN